jgi:hypothetical protein
VRDHERDEIRHDIRVLIVDIIFNVIFDIKLQNAELALRRNNSESEPNNIIR